jgi:hypothetical protein
MSELTRDQALGAVISGRGPAYLRGVDLSTLDLSNAGWLMDADLRQANLSQTNLARANLKGANAEKANLKGAHLFAANMEGVDMRRAKLNGANLKMANLRGANLKGAALMGANFIQADLREANLEGAELEGANFEGADLGKANLNGANVGTANFEGANLQGASLYGTTLLEKQEEQVPEMPFDGFAGMVSSIQLTDLIQLLCLTRQDFLLKIKSPQAEGVVHIRTGRVTHAQTDVSEGEEAFFEMFHWANGRFETLPLEEEGEDTINKPLEHLIVESMRQRDERETTPDHWDLLQEIREHLPLIAYPSRELMDLIALQGKNIRHDEELQITDAFESGDGGGIFCSVLVDDEIVIAPLDHIDMKPGHPLSDKIAAFQAGGA